MLYTIYVFALDISKMQNSLQTKN